MRQTTFRHPIDKAIGQAIKELRNQTGLKMRELAAIGNVSHSFFGKIENYDRRLTYGELREVASWIGVEVSEIITKATQIEQQGRHVQAH